MYYSYCTVCTEAKDVCPRTVLYVLRLKTYVLVLYCVYWMLMCVSSLADEPSLSGLIAQFTITINSNVCPHIRVPNIVMRNPMRDVTGIFNSEARY